MNIIAVDDEQFALELSEQAIREALPDCELSCFTSPGAALAYAKDNQVDIAFLDIEMGGMNGIVLAKMLKEVYGKTNIVFVTGYSEYALDSFSVKPCEYFLKPLTKEAVLLAMEELRHPVDKKASARIYIQTFGHFEVFIYGKPLKFAGERAKEVFAYLVDRQGAAVKTADIAAAVWYENTDDKYTQGQARKAIAAMKKTLVDNDVADILVKDWNSLSIDTTKVVCDMYDFWDGGGSSVNAYLGEYMANYGWAEFTAGLLSRKANIS